MRHRLRATVFGAMSLLVTVITPAWPLPACLEACRGESDCCATQPCLQEPCAFVKAEETALREDLDACIAACPATSPGRCTVLLGCVRKCQRFFREDMKTTVREAFAGTTCSVDCTIKGRRAIRAAQRVCRGCTSVTTTTSTTTTSSTTTLMGTTTTSNTTTTLTRQTTTTTAGSTTTTPPSPPEDRCQRQCLDRIDSLQSCYDSCDDACHGNQRALEICQGVCRNSTCLAIKARCAWDPVEPTPEDVDGEYRRCCTRQGSCVSRSETDVCNITTSTTTTTTSTTSTASTSSTTSTTRPPL